MHDAPTIALVNRRVVRAFELLASSYARIRGPVVEFDRAVFGRLESFGELGLRGQMFIVETQLRLLEALPTSPDDVEWAALAPQLPEVAAFIRLELAFSTAEWTPYRKARSSAESTMSAALTEGQRVRRYHTEILAAQQRLYAIASAPRVDGFLLDGATCDRSPRVQSACAQIHRALQLRVTGCDALTSAASGLRA
jgi:hypothetical protein